MIFQLKRRGRGTRESGAFLLGPQDSAAGIATAFICYDDLDPDAYLWGAISFHASGYAALWKRCREKNLRVLADVHTHPGHYISQSSIDQRNPMIPVKGHTAISCRTSRGRVGGRFPLWAYTSIWAISNGASTAHLKNLAV